MNLPPLWNNGLIPTLIVLTLVLGAASAAALLVRRSAARRNCVLLPALFMACLAPLAVLIAPIAGVAVEIPLLPGAPAEPAPSASMGLDAAAPTNVAPMSDVAAAIDASSSESPPHLEHASHAPSNRRAWISAASVFIAVWSIGTLAGLIGLSVAWRRLRRLRAVAHPVDTPELIAAAECAARILGCAQYPPLAVSSRVATPVAVGSQRSGVVLLPPGLADRMSHDQMVHVLVHEGAHLTHGDPTLRIIQRLGAALWWWHPLVHIVNRQLSRTREELCDNVVLSSSDAVRYSETLLACGRLVSAARTPALAIGLFPTPESLECRIRNLLNPKRNTMNRSRPAILLGACVAVAGTTMFAGAARITAVALDAPFNPAVNLPTHQQDDTTREFVLAFPDATTGHLDVDIKSGDIIVKGYPGNEVIVRLTSPDLAEGHGDIVDGLRNVRSAPLDFNIRQSGRTIEVNGDSWDETTHLEILVPYRTDLTLDTYRDGVLSVTDVTGVIKARSYFNPISLINIGGSADVYGYHGDQTAIFNAVDGPVSFETYHGVVDVTLPGEVKADTRTRSKRGAVRTDFNLAVDPDLVRKAAQPNGKRTIDFSKFVTGQINGGGFPLSFETNTGDILLRRGVRAIPR